MYDFVARNIDNAMTVAEAEVLDKAEEDTDKIDDNDELEDDEDDWESDEDEDVDDDDDDDWESDDDEGKWGYIDKSGEFIIKPKFDDALDFCDGVAPVEVDDKYGYIVKS